MSPGAAGTRNDRPLNYSRAAVEYSNGRAGQYLKKKAAVSLRAAWEAMVRDLSNRRWTYLLRRGFTSPSLVPFLTVLVFFIVFLLYRAA
jgi:hypothetical protein